MVPNGNSSGSLKRIMKLLEKWPLDHNKSGGRDLGEYLRCTINEAYSENKFQTEPKYWDKQYIAIQKLVNNINRDKCQRSLASSATGLTAEQCNLALSNDVLEHLKKKEESFFKKLVSLKPGEK